MEDDEKRKIEKERERKTRKVNTWLLNSRVSILLIRLIIEGGLVNYNNSIYWWSLTILPQWWGNQKTIRNSKKILFLKVPNDDIIIFLSIKLHKVYKIHI